MTSSSELEPAYKVEYDGMVFTVCAYRDMVIHHVTTNDLNFKTPEGIGVGDLLSKVLEISNQPLNTERGWAYFVLLKSGWAAAFVQGDSMTDAELSPNARVSFLFKR